MYDGKTIYKTIPEKFLASKMRRQSGEKEKSLTSSSEIKSRSLLGFFTVHIQPTIPKPAL